MIIRPAGTPRTFRRWIRYGFLAWAVVSTSWLVNTFRTRGVADSLLASDAKLTVRSSPESLAFLPRSPDRRGLVFFVGAGVSAAAYAPLLRPIAERRFPVFIVRLPMRIAPLETHKQEALRRARAILAANPSIERWVVAGHSLGGALAARLARENPPGVAEVVLIGTTHPKRFDLSQSKLGFTKVYATADGVAPMEKIVATKHLLPPATRWVEVKGGNHSQFAHYGHQFLDGSPTITRERQQEITRTALFEALERADS